MLNDWNWRAIRLAFFRVGQTLVQLKTQRRPVANIIQTYREIGVDNDLHNPISNDEDIQRIGIRPLLALFANHFSGRGDFQRNILFQQLDLRFRQITKHLELPQVRVERAASIVLFDRGLMVYIPSKLVEHVSVEFQQMAVRLNHDRR